MGDGSATQLTILGGGAAGLAVAHYARRAGVRCELFERAPTFGGLCRTFACGPHRYDAGAHRFHDRDPEITADVRALLGEDLCAVHAPSQILDRGRFIDFPPSPLNWLRGRGAVETLGAVADLLHARWRPRPERTFEDRALNRYGRRLGEPLLLRYSEKLWGMPAAALVPDVATRRLSGLSLRTVFVEMLTPERKSAHLDGEFLYPRAGYGAIADALAASAPPSALHASHEVVGLECRGGRVVAVRFADRPPAPVGDRLVATVPLTRVVQWLGDALPASVHGAAARLRFRHVRLVFLRLSVPRCTPNATVYLPDPTLCVSRVSEPKNRSASMAPADETALLAEVPCSDGEPLATLSDAALTDRVVRELAAVGLLDPATVRDTRHHLLPNAYPVYALDYPDAATTVRDGLRAIANLDLLGRNGLFWYSHLHDQLRLAKDYVAGLPAFDPAIGIAGEHRAAHAQVGREAVPRPAAG